MVLSGQHSRSGYHSTLFMSRNANHVLRGFPARVWCLVLALVPFSASAQSSGSIASSLGLTSENRARVVIVHHPAATEVFQARPDIVRGMVRQGLTNLTARANPAEVWQSLVSTQDVVGIKILTGSGPNVGTRPAVVAAVVETLLEAGLSPDHIIVWDRSLGGLSQPGFQQMKNRFGIRLESSIAAGYDEDTFYENNILGALVWGDYEFGKMGEDIGRKSFVSKLVTDEITKLVMISPLLNHNRAGVSGNLYSLASGSVDNFARFEASAQRLAVAVPEICALPELGDRVVLNVVDALVGQYEGEQRGLLHYSAPVNEIRLSFDPVALDVLSLQELERQRQEAGLKSGAQNRELYQNAALLELGISNPSDILIERLP